MHYLAVAVSVVEKVWNNVQSLVKFLETEVSWSFESGSAEEVVVNTFVGINKLLPDNI